jgi:DNA-binding NarL/FixJ family response regulator
MNFCLYIRTTLENTGSYEFQRAPCKYAITRSKESRFYAGLQSFHEVAPAALPSKNQVKLSKNCRNFMHVYVKLFNQLIPREQEVLKLLAEGKFNKQIANSLSVALSTVELYRYQILKKMKAKNILALVRVYSL